jgi:hypothetical protein
MMARNCKFQFSSLFRHLCCTKEPNEVEAVPEASAAAANMSNRGTNEGTLPCSMARSVLAKTVHDITSRAMYISNATDNSGDLLDAFHDDLTSNWSTIKSKWSDCVETNMSKETFAEMRESVIGAVLPERSVVCSPDLQVQQAATLITKHILEAINQLLEGENAFDNRAKFVTAMDEHVLVLCNQSCPFKSTARYTDTHIKRFTTEKDLVSYLQEFSREMCYAVIYFTVNTMLAMQRGDRFSLPVWSCVCCYEREINILFNPCKHRCLCSVCYEQFRNLCKSSCPLCRSRIDTAVQLRRSKESTDSSSNTARPQASPQPAPPPGSAAIAMPTPGPEGTVMQL